MDLSIFKTYRINLVRQNDLKHLPGYVSDCRGSEIDIRTSEEIPTVGDLVAAQIIIHQRVASFVGIVRSVSVGAFTLEVTTPISLESTDQSARRELKLPETMHWNGRSFEVEIIDVAHEGIGLLTLTALPVDAEILVDLPGSAGQAKIPFKVKYCLPITESDQFKVGCQLDCTDANLLSQYTLFLQSNDPLANSMHKKAS